jgi:hypothetical protein
MGVVVDSITPIWLTNVNPNQVKAPMTKLLKEIYKSYEGARKRAAFENSLARFEFEHGHKAKLYHYTVVEIFEFPLEKHWRVARAEAVQS